MDAKISVDPAENEPRKECWCRGPSILAESESPRSQREEAAGPAVPEAAAGQAVDLGENRKEHTHLGGRASLHFNKKRDTTNFFSNLK